MSTTWEIRSLSMSAFLFVFLCKFSLSAFLIECKSHNLLPNVIWESRWSKLKAAQWDNLTSFLLPVSLLWANVHSSFSPAAMTTPASLFFPPLIPDMQDSGTRGTFFPSFLCSERHVSRGRRPSGNQCGGCCSSRPASWLCLIVAELEGVAQPQGVCGLCRGVLSACVFFLRGFAPLLSGSEAENSGLHFSWSSFSEIKNKNSASCAVKGFLSFFPCYFILSLKPIRSFYFIDFKDRWELMLQDRRRMAAHLLENYKTDSGESAQLDLFPNMCLSSVLKGRYEMHRISENALKPIVSNHWSAC